MSALPKKMETDVEITITNRQKKYPLNRQQIRHWVHGALHAQGEDRVEVGLIFVNDRLMRQFNERYRGVDAPTDVLAFPIGPPCLPTGEPIAMGKTRPHWGDVVISLERADQEAYLFGRTYREHLFGLLIHGLLHLLGYDHERSRAEAARMKRRERALFERCYQNGV